MSLKRLTVAALLAASTFAPRVSAQTKNELAPCWTHVYKRPRHKGSHVLR